MLWFCFISTSKLKILGYYWIYFISTWLNRKPYNCRGDFDSSTEDFVHRIRSLLVLFFEICCFLISLDIQSRFFLVLEVSISYIKFWKKRIPLVVEGLIEQSTTLILASKTEHSGNSKTYFWYRFILSFDFMFLRDNGFRFYTTRSQSNTLHVEGNSYRKNFSFESFRQSLDRPSIPESAKKFDLSLYSNS